MKVYWLKCAWVLGVSEEVSLNKAKYVRLCDGSFYVSGWRSRDAQSKHYFWVFLAEMNIRISLLSRADCLPSNPWRAWVKQKTEEGGTCPLLPPHWLGWDLSSYLGPSHLSRSSLPLPLNPTQAPALIINHLQLPESPAAVLHPIHEPGIESIKLSWRSRTQKSRLKVKIPECQSLKEPSETQHPQVHRWRNWNPEKLSPISHWQLMEEAGPESWRPTSEPPLFDHVYVSDQRDSG